MKKVYLILLGFVGFYASAQVKIGDNPTVPHPSGSALLEMESTNKGLLLPRVALTTTTAFAPLSAHVAGMTVYNTATAGDVVPGFYYNDGTKWARLGNVAEGGLIVKRVACAGTKTQTITDPDTPVTEGILVSYEDPSGDVISGAVKTRTAGASFVVEFAAAPPVNAFINYAYPGNSGVLPTGPQGPIGLTGATGATGATGPAGANAIFKGVVSCAGTMVQTISDTNVTAGAAITVTYEDPSGDLIYTTVKSRIASTNFVVQFAAIPPLTAKVNYTIVP